MSLSENVGLLRSSGIEHEFLSEKKCIFLSCFFVKKYISKIAGPDKGGVVIIGGRHIPYKLFFVVISPKPLVIQRSFFHVSYTFKSLKTHFCCFLVDDICCGAIFPFVLIYLTYFDLSSLQSVSECVQYYYLSKKSENYKQLLRKQSVKKRRQFAKAQVRS